MLKRDDIDTIDVCVHNNLHTPISIAAMKAGYDVYCEKPEAASYHDAKMMIDCAKKLGRKLHVQISSLMTPQTRIARDMIKNGDLGVIYFANLELINRRNRPGLDVRPGMPYSLSTDFYSTKVAGRGKAIDHGVYAIGQILYLLGMPVLKSVSGFAKQAIAVDPKLITNPDGYGIEDISGGLAKFSNDTAFHYMFASACNYKDYSMTYILGTKGGLEIKDMDGGGGRWARTPEINIAFPYRAPELTFYGKTNGREVITDMKCDENGSLEMRRDPRMLLYNDNQAMWLAYKLGILDDSSRYNTPEIALGMLLLTDGIFLSQELGREMMAEEIKALSPEMYVHEQMIGSEMVHYDTNF